MKIVKTILSILLSFILMLGLLGSTLLVIANNYVQRGNLLQKLEETNLYNSVYDEVRDGFENYIYQSGLDINIIDKICTRDKVKKDITAVVNSMYGEGEATIDSSSIRTNLDLAINEYVESQNRKLSNEEKDNIKKFEDLIEESYKDQIGLYKKGSNEAAKKLPEVLAMLKKYQMIAVGVTAISLILLVIVNAKVVSVAGSYVGVSLVSCGVIMTFINSIVSSKIEIDSLVIFTKSLTNAVIIILKEILMSIQTYGLWYIAIGIFVIIFMNTILLLGKKYED